MNNMHKPYVIGNSLIFNFGDRMVQFGPISVKELSIHDIAVPQIIVFRPGDYLTIEFNFFHQFFVMKRPLIIYALKEQIATLRKVMQWSLLGGDKGWAEQNLRQQAAADDDVVEQVIGAYAKNTPSNQLLADIDAGHCSGDLLTAIRLFINQQLADRAFAIQVNGKAMQAFEELEPINIQFIEYNVDSPFSIDGYQVSIGNSLEISSVKGVVLYQEKLGLESPTSLMLKKFPLDMINRISDDNRSGIIANGIAQIGSGDGMAYTPDQDTSCTLIRQTGSSYLLDASMHSIIKAAYLGINVYKDEVIALLTHGFHGDHGPGLYFIARTRNLLGFTPLKIFCHPYVFENYVEKCAYVYQCEFPGRKIEEIMDEIRGLFVYYKPSGVVFTPFNTHSVPTTGFYFEILNFYVSGDMSGAELTKNKKIGDIDITSYYFKSDLLKFDEYRAKVVNGGRLAIECGQPPIHTSKDVIVEVLGGEEQYKQRLQSKELLLYHTSGQQDAQDWIVL